jgi:hypothetical protein
MTTATWIRAWSLAAAPRPTSWKRGSASSRSPAWSGWSNTTGARACAFAASSSRKSAAASCSSDCANGARRASPKSSVWWKNSTASALPKPKTAAIRSTGRVPEAWLESQARAQIETLDASLLCDPIYDQVPAFAGGERGILDLLAVDRAGRLTVVELKASADLHLPLQALDYWIRVKWHLDRGEFTAHGYFPGLLLRPEPPRLLLVSPSLEFQEAVKESPASGRGRRHRLPHL